jgi:hypothetical protein
MGIAAIIYTKLKALWTNWVVWFVGVLVIYITCVSGVVFDIIDEVPFFGYDPKTDKIFIFSTGVTSLLNIGRPIRSIRSSDLINNKQYWNSIYFNCFNASMHEI